MLNSTVLHDQLLAAQQHLSPHPQPARPPHPVSVSVSHPPHMPPTTAAGPRDPNTSNIDPAIAGAAMLSAPAEPAPQPQPAAAPDQQQPQQPQQQQQPAPEQPRRTYGKRELSTSKRAAQNRAAQVSDPPPPPRRVG